MTGEAQTPGRGPVPGALWLAFAWGFAEATIFFLVPDVLTSRLVLQRARLGYLACLVSLAGALLGGALLFEWGRNSEHQQQALALLDHVPGITPGLASQARNDIEERQLAALFAGPVAGIPYKLYAVQMAGATSASLGGFLLVSAVSRLGRFLMVTAAAWLAGLTILSKVNEAGKLRIHAGFWILFYVGYFWRMGL